MRVRRTLGAASCVRQPLRFAVNELRRAGGPVEREYRLRRGGRVARLRQPLLDMWVLEEVFRFREYEPPHIVRDLLRALGRPPRVLDLGGHVGLFGLYVDQAFPGASITSFEPDPDNARLLRRCIEANALDERWKLVEACAAVRDGSTEFVSSHHLSRAGAGAHEALEQMQAGIGSAFPFLAGTPLTSSRRRTVDTRDVFPWLSRADFVKMDIEGAEWELLADPRFASAPARALVLEYHPSYGPGDSALSVLRELLERAGYVLGAPRIGTDGGVLWAWRDRRQATAPGNPS